MVHKNIHGQTHQETLHEAKKLGAALSVFRVKKETKKGKARVPARSMDGGGQNAQHVPGEMQEDESRGSAGKGNGEEGGGAGDRRRAIILGIKRSCSRKAWWFDFLRPRPKHFSLIVPKVLSED